MEYAAVAQALTRFGGRMSRSLELRRHGSEIQKQL